MLILGINNGLNQSIPAAVMWLASLVLSITVGRKEQKTHIMNKHQIQPPSQDSENNSTHLKLSATTDHTTSSFFISPVNMFLSNHVSSSLTETLNLHTSAISLTVRAVRMIAFIAILYQNKGFPPACFGFGVVAITELSLHTTNSDALNGIFVIISTIAMLILGINNGLNQSIPATVMWLASLVLSITVGRKEQEIYITNNDQQTSTIIWNINTKSLHTLKELHDTQHKEFNKPIIIYDQMLQYLKIPHYDIKQDFLHFEILTFPHQAQQEKWSHAQYPCKYPDQPYYTQNDPPIIFGYKLNIIAGSQKEKDDIMEPILMNIKSNIRPSTYVLACNMLSSKTFKDPIITKTADNFFQLCCIDRYVKLRTTTPYWRAPTVTEHIFIRMHIPTFHTENTWYLCAETTQAQENDNISSHFLMIHFPDTFTEQHSQRTITIAYLEKQKTSLSIQTGLVCRMLESSTTNVY